MSFHVLEYVYYCFEWKLYMLWCLVKVWKKWPKLQISYFWPFSTHYFMYEMMWYDDENFSGHIYMDIVYVVKISERFDVYLFFKNPEPKLSFLKNTKKTGSVKQWPVWVQTCFWTFKWPNWVLSIRTCFVVDSILDNFVEIDFSKIRPLT